MKNRFERPENDPNFKFDIVISHACGKLLLSNCLELF